MIASARQEIIRGLERLSELAPDLRFGQMVANLALISSGPWDETLWDLEDDQLLAAIDGYIADIAQRNECVG